MSKLKNDCDDGYQPDINNVARRTDVPKSERSAVRLSRKAISSIRKAFRGAIAYMKIRKGGREKGCGIESSEVLLQVDAYLAEGMKKQDAYKAAGVALNKSWRTIQGVYLAATKGR